MLCVYLFVCFFFQSLKDVGVEPPQHSGYNLREGECDDALRLNNGHGFEVEREGDLIPRRSNPGGD